jgi:hypothetical protein
MLIGQGNIWGSKGLRCRNCEGRSCEGQRGVLKTGSTVMAGNSLFFCGWETGDVLKVGFVEGGGMTGFAVAEYESSCLTYLV